MNNDYQSITPGVQVVFALGTVSTKFQREMQLFASFYIHHYHPYPVGHGRLF